VFRTEQIAILRTPFRAPQANGVAERFVRTVRTECLDWLLLLNRQHLEQTVATFVDHYNPASSPSRVGAQSTATGAFGRAASVGRPSDLPP